MTVTPIDICLALLLSIPPVLLIADLSRKLSHGRRRHRSLLIGGCVAAIAALAYNLSVLPHLAGPVTLGEVLGETRFLLALAFAWVSFWGHMLVGPIGRWIRSIA